MKTLSIGILVMVFFLSNLSVRAQVNQTAIDTTTVWQIITVDDNEFIGTITEETPATIKLQTETYGLIEISRTNISRMIRIDTNKMVNEEYMPDHLQSTRFFGLPVAIRLAKVKLTIKTYGSSLTSSAQAFQKTFPLESVPSLSC